jgi:hypothetical protein
LSGFRLHPLDIFRSGYAVARKVSLVWRRGGREKLRRRQPMTLADAADKLASATSLGTEKCAEALAHILSVMGRREDLRGGTSDRAFLAFKLHRFISGAGQVYSTLEPAAARRVVLEGQVFHPDDESARLYSRGAGVHRLVPQPRRDARTLSQRLHE